VARILIVGGGCRGRRLASELVDAGHALRITARREERRELIEATGAECWLGTPDRLTTLRAALDNLTLACWLLGSASASAEDSRELHSSRLQAFARMLIDTTVRGLVYEAAGTVPARDLATGERIVRAVADQNAIPLAVIRADPADPDAWLRDARAVVSRLLEPG
jgi:hypothetical protein